MRGVIFFMIQENKNINEKADDDRKAKEALMVEGIVEESLPSATFRVRLSDDSLVLAHLSGKMRLHYIKVLPGDKVIIELSPYDKTKGRITKRLK